MPYKDPERERARLHARRNTEAHKKYMREFSKKRRATAHGKARQAAADKKFRENNRDKFNAYQREWLRKHKTDPNNALRVSMVKRSRRLGVVIDRLPPENCESCNRRFADFSTARQRIPQADHCHTTGFFRGWICFRCNSALGFAQDNRENLLGLVAYLDKSEIWR